MNKKNYDLSIIAGPCSITPENTEEIINEIATITTPDNKRAIYGTRVVGLKSRTALSKTDEGMGIDYPVIKQALKLSEKDRRDLSIPSVELAEKIAQQTGLLITAEIMMPHIQLPFYEQKKVLHGNFLPWNPAVEQLGWNLLEMADFTKRNNWDIGIKHGKFLGKETLEIANHPDYKEETALEKVLVGLTTYIPEQSGELIIIHRGVDVPRQADYRNAIAHEIMKRVKPKVPKAQMYFDPTHTIGPKLKHIIVDETIAAMKLKSGDGFLYDGVLIEAGTSPTDAGEHLTIDELKYLVKELSKFRNLRSPKEPSIV
jgi:3-deoxy-D-arabino-heptulosonate 7-phosphate (DAHP) synthase